METNTPDLSALASLANTVAAQHSELVDAVAAERAANVALLDAVVERIRPALRALASRIKTGERTWWIGTTHTDTECTWSSDRGLYVGAADVGPERSNPGRDQNRGGYRGFDLFLTSDGRWLELAYTGGWSIWQGEETEWTAAETYVDTATVERDWGGTDVIPRIVAALQSHADGKAPERAKAARERAERIAAVARLIP